MSITEISSETVFSKVDPFMSSGLFYSYQMDVSTCQLRGTYFSLYFIVFVSF